jgi:hypothetical protein
MWLEMMLVMAEATPEGRLYVGDAPVRESDLARIARLVNARDAREVKKCLAELKSMGVYSVDENGAIYSRRMVRDVERRDRNRQNGRLGGNPRLTQPDNQESVNHSDMRGSDKPQFQANTKPGITAAIAVAELGAPASFARAFLAAGTIAGAILPHDAAEPERWVADNLVAAERLLACYDAEECMVRAHRLFAAKAAGKIGRTTTIEALEKFWGFSDIAGEAPRSSRAGTDIAAAYAAEHREAS